MLQTFQWNELSPANAAGVVASSVAVKNAYPHAVAGTLAASGLEEAYSLLVLTEIHQDSGGTLDVWMQTFLLGVWYDIVHIKQLAAGAGTINNAYVITQGASPVTTGVAFGTGTTPALLSDKVLCGPWGEKMRLVMQGGAGAVGGFAVKVTVAAQLHRTYHPR